LAWELVNRGTDVKVVDQNWHSSSSLVAAGLINPISGKRLVLQERADFFLNRAEATYHKLAHAFGSPVFHPTPLLRLFRDEAQRGYFERRVSDSAYDDYWEREASTDELAAFDADWGGAWQRRTGFVDTGVLLKGLRTWLRDRGGFTADKVGYDDIDLAGGRVRWRDVEADRLIFCEGFRALRNPWFGHLPFQPAKGEILALAIEPTGSLPNAIIHKGDWLAPRPDGTWRFGATHTWDPLDATPTEAGRNKLLDSLHRLVPGAQVQLLAHHAGVRPATRDRAPFLGTHPAHPALAIFNGFGAKGGLLIPAYATAMADHLCDGALPPPEADIARYG